MIPAATEEHAVFSHQAKAVHDLRPEDPDIDVTMASGVLAGDQRDGMTAAEHPVPEPGQFSLKGPDGQGPPFRRELFHDHGL